MIMKTRLLTLLAALFVLAWSAKADGIHGLTLTISHNAGASFDVSFPAEGWQELVLSERTASLVIKKVVVEADASVTDVEFCATMYSTSAGSASDDEWRSLSLENQGEGRWVLEMGEGVELVESEWLTENKTKTFEFHARGKAGSGDDISYDNGGENYKVTFSTGDDDWKVKFLKENTAQLDLLLNGETRSYSFNADGSRHPADQPGKLSSLAIARFGLSFLLADGMEWPDVSLQYRVYEEGQKCEAIWNRLDCQSGVANDGGMLYFRADNLKCSVTDGLTEGRNYVFEACYQVIVGGEYFFLGKDSEGSQFRFSVGGGTVQTEGIRSFQLTIAHDGEVFTESFPAEGWQNFSVDGLTSSLRLLRADVEADASMSYVGFCSTMYDAEDGWQHDDSAWSWNSLDYQGDGHWTLDWGDGIELVEDGWLTENKTKTFEFFVSAGNAKGQEYKYNNGINAEGYDNNYKVTFAIGIDPDGIGLTPACKAAGAAYNPAGQRVGGSQGGITVTAGKKTLRK